MNASKEFVAYIDESGDPDFNEHASKYFAIGAIICPKNEENEIAKAIEEIKVLENIGELKSAKVKSFSKRYRLCEKISSLGINILTITVNKEELSGGWIKRRENFYKFIMRKLNHELYRVYGNVNVSIHKYSGSKFQESLNKYLITKLQGELFSPNINIGVNNADALLQLTDFISGTIRKSISGEFDQMRNDILDLLKKQWKVRISIPDKDGFMSTKDFSRSGDYFDTCLKEAERYLKANTKNKNSAKIKSLEYLFDCALDSPDSFTYTTELLSWLSDLNIQLSEEQFRNEVIAALRDDGLIIVGTRKGLKIPTTPEDLVHYIEFSISLALPVLKRLKKALVFLGNKPEFNFVEKTLSKEISDILINVNV